MSACNFAPEAANNSWAWATNDPAQPAHYAEHVNCPYRLGGAGGKADQEGGLSTTDALGLSSGAAPGTSAGWTFTAPVGTTITGLTYERYIGHQFDLRQLWSPALRADGTIVPGETCLDSVENGETCSVGGPPGAANPQRSQVFQRMNCQSASCASAAGRTGMRHRRDPAQGLGGDVRRRR